IAGTNPTTGRKPIMPQTKMASDLRIAVALSIKRKGSAASFGRRVGLSRQIIRVTQFDSRGCDLEPSNLLLLHQFQLAFEAVEHAYVAGQTNQHDGQHGHHRDHSQSLLSTA